MGEGILTKVKKYVLDTILLSAARLAPFLWVILTLHNLLAVVRPFQLGIFDYWYPVLQGFDVNTIIGYGIGGYTVAIIIWLVAENYLDKERSRDHKAFAEQLPAAQVKIALLEGQLKTEKSDHANTQKNLDKMAHEYLLMDTNNKTNAGLVIDRNTEITGLKKSLQQARAERDQAKAEAEEARAKHSKAAHRATNAEALAAQAVIEELEPLLGSLYEYYAQLEAKVKEADLNRSIPAAAATTAMSNGNRSGQQIPPPNEPKKNYL